MSTAYTASAKQGCSTAATQQNYFSTVTRGAGQANHNMQIPALSNSTDNENNGETHAALIDISSAEAQQHILNYSSDQNLLQGQLNIEKKFADDQSHPDKPVYRLNQVRSDRENFAVGNNRRPSKNSNQAAKAATYNPR